MFKTVYKIVDKDGLSIDLNIFPPTKPSDPPIPLQIVNVEMVTMRDGQRVMVHTLRYDIPEG